MDVNFFGEEIEYKNASLEKRFLNFVIDYITRILLGVALGVIIGLVMALGDPNALDTLDSLDWMTELIIGYVLAIIYYFVLEATTGRTLGKLITKTKVITQKGDLPSPGTIFIRTLCRLIPFEPFSFAGDKPWGWHDSLSNTRVVEIPKTWHTQSDLNVRDDRDKDYGLNSREG